MNTVLTLNLLTCASREYKMGAELVKLTRENEFVASAINGLYYSFNGDDNLQLLFNTSSGYVFIDDIECPMPVCLAHTGSLIGWHISLPYSGNEGFIEDLLKEDKEDWHDDDKEALENARQLLESYGITF